MCVRMKASVYVLFLSLLMLNTVRGCPEMCVCKWKNGKQTIECGSRHLQAIPDGMDPNTQVLEFSSNKLQALRAQMFLKMDLINLQRIYLSQNRITTVDQHAFEGLTNLVELDLSGNLLDTVPTATFIDCPSLMRLTLSYNPIRVLKRGSFNHLTFLHSLELSNCNVDRIEEGAFQGLHSIEWLHLDGNKLTTIKGNKVLPESLRGIELQGNLWKCDCNMLDLYWWLVNLNVPYSVEPACKGPSKLTGRPIKSIPESELACLPNVSPTTFYLEIGEGKNISLLCHVHAVPEAHVSWWFQGQILQNDTFVAPGMRLMYYVEEGSEEKRSELFIYNTNPEDNGTFICSAENAAGTAQSNFTVKIILKEEPIVIIVSFPFEYFLAAIVGAGLLVVTILIIVIVSIVRCRTKRSRMQKKEKTKEVALQYQQHNTVKCMVSAKENNTETYRQQPFQTPTTRSCDDLLRSISPITLPPNQVRSPASLRRYQLEQNPDLINDAAESVDRRRDDGDGGIMEDRNPQSEGGEPLIHQSMVQFPITCLRNGRKLYNIHSWEGCPILDVEGYPMDYGLPKMAVAATAVPAPNFYRTLPYNRSGKRQSAAVPVSRYSREAEFLSRSAYEHYCTDVRYTADGYPVRSGVEVETLPSPPDGYKSEINPAPSSLPCCSAAVQWPQRMPANVHLINSGLEYDHQSKFAGVVGRRCVSAQTDTDDGETVTSTAANTTTTAGTHLPLNKTESTLNERNDPINEVLTESPDEGYEGEPSVV